MKLAAAAAGRLSNDPPKLCLQRHESSHLLLLDTLGATFLFLRDLPASMVRRKAG
jgi:hypothetical protein